MKGMDDSIKRHCITCDNHAQKSIRHSNWESCVKYRFVLFCFGLICVCLFSFIFSHLLRIRSLPDYSWQNKTGQQQKRQQRQQQQRRQKNEQQTKYKIDESETSYKFQMNVKWIIYGIECFLAIPFISLYSFSFDFFLFLSKYLWVFFYIFIIRVYDVSFTSYQY